MPSWTPWDPAARRAALPSLPGTLIRPDTAEHLSELLALDTEILAGALRPRARAPTRSSGSSRRDCRWRAGPWPRWNRSDEPPALSSATRRTPLPPRLLPGRRIGLGAVLPASTAPSPFYAVPGTPGLGRAHRAALIAAIAVARAVETVERRPGAVPSLRPAVGVTCAQRRVLLAAVPGFVAVRALSAFYLPLGPKAAALPGGAPVGRVVSASPCASRRDTGASSASGAARGCGTRRRLGGVRE